MKKLGKSYEIHTYEGAGHGFMFAQGGRRRREPEGRAGVVAGRAPVPQDEPAVGPSTVATTRAGSGR